MPKRELAKEFNKKIFKLNGTKGVRDRRSIRETRTAPLVLETLVLGGKYKGNDISRNLDPKTSSEQGEIGKTKTRLRDAKVESHILKKGIAPWD